MNEYSPITSEFASAEEEAAYERWLLEKVAASRADPSPPIPHDVVMARAREIIASARKR